MKLNKFSRNILSALTLLGIAASSLAAGADDKKPGGHYTLVELGSLGGTFSSAAAINNKRQIVGKGWRSDALECYSPAAETLVPCEVSFLWESGRMRALGTAYKGAVRTMPSGINDHGMISGTEEIVLPDPKTENGVLQYFKPFVYSHGGFRPLPVLSKSDYPSDYANGINAAGVITGFSREKDGIRTLVTWTNDRIERGPVVKDLFRDGYGINNKGIIAGVEYVYGLGEVPHGIVVDGARVTRLPGAVDSYSWMEALDLNDAGVVVGNLAPGIFKPFVATEWRLNERGLDKSKYVVKVFGTLPGHTNSQLTKLNKHGDSVGVSWNGETGDDRAIAVLNGKLVDLTAMMGLKKFVIRSATGINDNGDIVGEISGVDGTGPSRAYLLRRD